MAKISDYGNYETGKTQSEVETFKETGVLPVSGKYTDNGTMTTKNVKLSDLVGGGGGARYTPVTIANPTVSDGKITISPANNTIVTVTGLPDESFNFEIVAPQVADGEYIDIVIQAQTASGDYAEHPIEVQGFAPVTMDDVGVKTTLVSDGSWTHIALLGKCILVYWEVAGGSN